MNLNWQWFLNIYLFIDIWSTISSSDIYTALVDMETLINTEKELHNIVDLYLEAEMKRLEQVKELAAVFLKSNIVSDVTNAEEFLGNPINAFRLVKRLSVDCLPLLTLMNYTKISEVVSNHALNGKIVKFPDSEDLNGAAVALSRLQQMYNLTPATIAKGEIIPGIDSEAKLEAEDIFEVGRQLYITKDYVKSIQWLEEALSRDADTNLRLDMKSDLLEHLSFNNYMIGDHVKAYEYNVELLKHDPTHERGLANNEYYRVSSEMSKNQVAENQTNEDTNREIPYHETPEWQLTWSLYEQLCRNEPLLDRNKQAKLKCYYTKHNSPYLLLQPVKSEDVHHKPWLVVFYEVLSNREIDLIKNLSTPGLNRASVINKVTGAQEIASYRVSKSSWLTDEVHPTIYKISRRLEEVTGLNLIQGAEQLQVVNYGIGGQYDPHVDFARDDEPNSFKHLNLGNRIATVLFYMSDVKAGGATVFPYLKVGVWPKKGSAAFWYNLHKNGKGDLLTQHAACPVLVGSKWVSNKWIHEYHQEFRRRCGLKEDDFYEK